MTSDEKKSLITTITAILSGIDRTENESGNGWWETSNGAAFGAERLKAVIDAIQEL